MIVKSSETMMGFTVITVSDQIPANAYYAVFDGAKHKMLPVYDSDTMTFGIKGSFDLTGKNVTFSGKESKA